MGGYLVIIYARLMHGLARKMPNTRQRHRHIIDRMLFAAELCPRNVQKLRKIFGSSLSIFHGDSLKQLDTMRHLGMKQFTCVVGNPPFEEGGKSLWPSFVERSLKEWIVPGGYFAMLLPPGYRKPSDENSRTKETWELMTRQCRPLVIQMFDARKSSEVFGNSVSIQFDIVVLQRIKNIPTHLTVLKGTSSGSSSNGRVALYKMPFLTNGHFKEWSRVLLDHPSQQRSCRVLYNGSLYSVRSWIKVKEHPIGPFRYPVVKAVRKGGELVLAYADSRSSDGGFGVPKVIFNYFGGWNRPVLDWEGKYGMTEGAFGLIPRSRDEGRRIVAFFTDDMLRVFKEDMTWGTSTQTIFWKLFYYLPMDFYKLF